MVTVHRVDKWQFTRKLCEDGQALMDEWDKAIARVTMYHGEIPGDVMSAAGSWARSYYIHRRECVECELEWRKEGA